MLKVSWGLELSVLGVGFSLHLSSSLGINVKLQLSLPTPSTPRPYRAPGLRPTRRSGS